MHDEGVRGRSDAELRSQGRQTGCLHELRIAVQTSEELREPGYDSRVSNFFSRRPTQRREEGGPCATNLDGARDALQLRYGAKTGNNVER